MVLRALVVTIAGLAVALPSAAQAQHKRAKRRSEATAPAKPPAPAHDPANGDDVPPPQAAVPRAPAAPGVYQGVRPGRAALPPHAPKPGGPPRLTWSGFMMTETGSGVFLQLTSPVEYAVARSPHAIVLTLKGCRIHLRNNARLVNTSFFPTPVKGIRARRRGKNVVVTIALRRSVESQPRLEPGEAGYQFLMLDFPRSDEAPASQSAAE